MLWYLRDVAPVRWLAWVRCRRDDRDRHVSSGCLWRLAARITGAQKQRVHTENFIRYLHRGPIGKLRALLRSIANRQQRDRTPVTLDLLPEDTFYGFIV